VASRQDQLHSYQFAVQRLVAAIVAREADPIRPPTRRLTGAALAGVLIAALCLAAVAVYGVLAPGGGTGWRSQGAIVVEKETGARYVYLDGSLYPVLNYASALLLAGSAGGVGSSGGAPRPVLVPRRAIEGVPRGPRLGIPGAPDSLPAPDRLLTGAWAVCATPAGGSSLHIGQKVAGGRALGPGDGLLVRAPAGEVSLIWHGHRYRLSDFALGALAWRGEPVAPVAAALLNAVPEGPPLAAPAVPGLGGPSRVAFARSGQVLVVRPQGATPQYVVAVPAGLAAISQVQANLLLAEPEIAALQGRPGAIELNPDGYTAAPVAAPLTPAPGDLAPPLTMPVPVRPSTMDAAVCVSTAGSGSAPVVAVDVPDTSTGPAAPVGSNAPVGSVAGGVDRVLVPPGRGAVVEALAAPESPSGALSLVTDLGVRYPLPRPEVLGLLGYPAVTPVRLPAGLVALLPVGRALDPDAARVPVPAGD
jgi:type VII secretion protein EccB